MWVILKELLSSVVSTLLREGYWKHWRRGFRIMHIVTKNEMKWIPKNTKERSISAMRAMFWTGTRWTRAEECAASRQYTTKRGTRRLQIHNSINRHLWASLYFAKLHLVWQLSLTSRKFEFRHFQCTNSFLSCCWAQGQFQVFRYGVHRSHQHSSMTRWQHKDRLQINFALIDSLYGIKG